jgi:hypothetical protein
MLNINPWGLMWVNPREAIRSVVAYNPSYRFILISALYGFVQALRIAQVFSLGSYMNFWLIVLSCLVLCIPIGAISLSLTSLFVFWVGKLIKGKAAYSEVRAALTWSNVTVIVSIFLVGITVAIFGPDFFTQDFANHYYPGYSFLLITVFALELILSIWSFVLFIKALSEVQQISSWMALLNIVLTVILLSILTFFVGKFFRLFQLMTGS